MLKPIKKSVRIVEIQALGRSVVAPQIRLEPLRHRGDRHPVNLAERKSAFDHDLGAMPPDASIWPTSAHTGGVSSGTVYANFQRYLRDAGLPRAGLHVLRHTAAKLRRDAGQSIEDVSRFLDHSTLAVTTTYLRRLEGEQDAAWPRVAGSLGLAIN